LVEYTMVMKLRYLGHWPRICAWLPRDSSRTSGHV